MYLRGEEFSLEMRGTTFTSIPLVGPPLAIPFGTSRDRNDLTQRFAFLMYDLVITIYK